MPAQPGLGRSCLSLLSRAGVSATGLYSGCTHPVDVQLGEGILQDLVVVDELVLALGIEVDLGRGSRGGGAYGLPLAEGHPPKLHSTMPGMCARCAVRRTLFMLMIPGCRMSISWHATAPGAVCGQGREWLRAPVDQCVGLRDQAGPVGASSTSGLSGIRVAWCTALRSHELP